MGQARACAAWSGFGWEGGGEIGLEGKETSPVPMPCTRVLAQSMPSIPAHVCRLKHGMRCWATRCELCVRCVDAGQGGVAAFGSEQHLAAQPPA